MRRSDFSDFGSGVSIVMLVLTVLSVVILSPLLRLTGFSNILDVTVLIRNSVLVQWFRSSDTDIDSGSDASFSINGLGTVVFEHIIIVISFSLNVSYMFQTDMNRGPSEPTSFPLPRLLKAPPHASLPWQTLVYPTPRQWYTFLPILIILSLPFPLLAWPEHEQAVPRARLRRRGWSGHGQNQARNAQRPCRGTAPQDTCEETQPL